MAGHIIAGTSRTRRNHRPMSEINVTPLVDVMLVLLIVFMVAAPLLTVGVAVDLPDTQAGAITEETEPLTISIQKSGDVYLQETKIALKELVPKLVAISKGKQDARIYVRGDDQVEYGRVAVVMGLLNQAGFTKVALVHDAAER